MDFVDDVRHADRPSEARHIDLSAFLTADHTKVSATPTKVSSTPRY